jgi:glutamine synthetase
VNGSGADLDLDLLGRLASEGVVDTVVVCFADLHGRLVGKRATADHFLEHVAGGEGMHACDYLLAVDLDMTPLPGYRLLGWEHGYGDYRAVPDVSTLRRIPWLERTALVLCDLKTESGETVEIAPRRILQRQLECGARKGLAVEAGSELEFYLFRDSFESLADTDYRAPVPQSTFIEDYHVLQTSRDEDLLRQIRSGMAGARIPVETSKGECGRGQQEVNLRHAPALEMADRHVVYKNGVKEIAALNGKAVTFMAKYSADDSGSSCHLHTSLRSIDGRHWVMWDAKAQDHLSTTFRHYLGGMVATAREMALLMAPTVNSYKRFRPNSWAPTAIAWGHDNRTCGFRVVGERDSFRVECRIPGADANPYLALAALIAGGLWGIEKQIDPPSAFSGNAYSAAELARVPTSLHEAIDAFEGSAVARSAFGDHVVDHIVNTARQEQQIFETQVVTDWELRRYFERI